MKRLLFSLSVLAFASCAQVAEQAQQVPHLLGTLDDKAAATFFDLVVDASLQAMEYHNEAIASQVPDLQAISSGHAGPGVTEDVSRTLDACVEVRKQLDDEDGSFFMHASYTKCTDGRDGFIDATHAFLPVEKDATTYSTSQEVDFAGYRFGHTEAEGTILWNTTYPVAEGPVTVVETGDMKFDVDVTSAMGLGDGHVVVRVDMQHQTKLTVDHATGDLALDGKITLKTQGEAGTLEVKGTWSPKSCGSGGWKDGSVKLESGGKTFSVTLACGVLSNGAGRYSQAAVDGLKKPRPGCEYCDFKNANLSKTNLAYTAFENSDFTGANLAQVNWTRPYFSGPSVPAGTTTSKLVNAKGLAAKVDQGEADGIDATGSSWVWAKWTNTNAKNAKFDSSYWNAADLTGTRFESSSFKGAFLDGAKLHSTGFNKADLTNASLRDTKADSDTDFRGAKFSNTVCPDATNSDDNDGTCCGHFMDASGDAVTPKGCST